MLKVPVQPLEVEAASELARRGKPGWWSFCLGNVALFLIEPSLTGNRVALAATAVNLVVLALKGTLMTRWGTFYPARPAASIRTFGILSAIQAANVSGSIAFLLAANRFDAYGFISVLVTLACAQAAVVAQCPHLKIMRTCLIAYLAPAALGAFAVGGLQGIGTGLLLVAELLFLIYQGAQMNAAYWQTLRENHELRLAREQADQASRSKSQFLAKVSHELRTPIHGVMGLTSLVLDSSINDEQRDHLETAHRSATSLLELVNHLLDLSKIEANRVELEHIPFRPAEVLEQVVKPLRHAAEAKSIALRLECGFDGRLIGDPVRLQQILTNLVSNAVKFTNQGAVDIRVQTTPGDGGGAVCLQVDVADTGVGIASDKLDLIFDPFRQAETSVGRHFGGTGLGLSIAQNLTELMGGTLSVSSTPDAGSSFRFTCPFPEAGDQREDHPAEPARFAPRPARRLRVLVADDNPVNRRLAEKQLSNWGHAVALAEDGHEAVQLATAREFDLILMDVLMPELDGSGATEQLRVLGIGTPIIAVTANALEDQRQRCLDAGMNAVLAKPYTAQQLFLVVEQFAVSGGDDDAGVSAPARRLPA